jgi:hypothetical protein
MIYNPKVEGNLRNFGNALFEVIVSDEIQTKWGTDEQTIFFPNGTVISNNNMEKSIDRGYQPFFISCGWDGDDILDLELVEQSLFLGSRGEMTKNELGANGIEAEVVGEPAELLPSIVPSGSPNGYALAFKNVHDPGEYSEDTKFQLKADKLITPLVDTKEDVINLIQLISGARFVLTGSLAVAAVAKAYGTPFSPLETEFDDSRFRWNDWFTSIGIPPKATINWPKDVRQGREWYNAYARGVEGE